jgi:hypothetical protein
MEKRPIITKIVIKITINDRNEINPKRTEIIFKY